MSRNVRNVITCWKVIMFSISVVLSYKCEYSIQCLLKIW